MEAHTHCASDTVETSRGVLAGKLQSFYVEICALKPRRSPGCGFLRRAGREEEVALRSPVPARSGRARGPRVHPPSVPVPQQAPTWWGGAGHEEPNSAPAGLEPVTPSVRNCRKHRRIHRESVLYFFRPRLRQETKQRNYHIALLTPNLQNDTGIFRLCLQGKTEPLSSHYQRAYVTTCVGFYN